VTLDLDATVGWLWRPDQTDALRITEHTRLLVGVSLVPRLQLLVGAGYQLSWSDDPEHDPQAPPWRQVLRSSDLRMLGWPSLTFGLRVPLTRPPVGRNERMP
jgi:hypothetical protein